MFFFSMLIQLGDYRDENTVQYNALTRVKPTLEWNSKMYKVLFDASKRQLSAFNCPAFTMEYPSYAAACVAAMSWGKYARVLPCATPTRVLRRNKQESKVFPKAVRVGSWV